MTGAAAAPPQRLRWSFHPPAQWPALCGEWDALNATAGALPFLESAFLTPLLAEFGDSRLTLAFARRAGSGRPVAAALLQRAGAGRVATFQPSQLPLGAWLVGPGEDAVALARSLMAQLPGLVLGLGLTQIDPRLQPRPADTPRSDTLDYLPTAWVDVAGSFDAYWETRGKNLRVNMRKQRAKLEADGIALQFDTVTQAADVPAALADYGRLESAGWKAGMGTAVNAGNAQGRFYTAMLQNFCAQGRGRIWRLRFGEQVVAMDLCIEAGGTLVVLKTAFDPEQRSVSPAFLLHQDAFRQVFDEPACSSKAHPVQRIEFYGRLMEWHTRWTSNTRMLYHANVYRWALLAQLRRRLAARRAAPAQA